MEKNIPQKKAITTIDRNVAVNAGAGTGKTKVLTERFIEILENGNLEKDKEVESIVAITFTKKAAQEMIDRIRREIRSNFKKDTKWRRFYRDMEKANISTIHGFCANILKENPIEAKIDPLFQVLEDYTSETLLKNSIEEVLSKAIENNEEVYKLLRILRRNTLNTLIEDFYNIYNMVRAEGISFKELREKSLAYLGKLKIEEPDLEIIKDTFLYLMDNLAKNSKIYKLREDNVWLNFLNKEYKNEELPEILDYLYGNMGTSSKEPEKMELLKLTLEKTMLSSESSNAWIYEIILDLLIEIDLDYHLKKKELKGLDYDDLQIITLNLLDNDNIRKKYQKKYKYIMIDEFQDTNELQKKIFYKLTTVDTKLDRENLFIVGDPKQSIYGFRGANINVFYDVMKDIEKVSKEKTIVLEKNYRTVDTVLNFINNIFSKIMLNKYDALSHFFQSENSIDIEILENEDLEIPENTGESEYYKHYEAELIAKRIKQLVDEKKFEYKDFAILFRATTRNHIYEEALKNYGIPYYNTGGKRYFMQQEVLDLINGLRSISNPFDSIATIGFLRSPMIGLKDTTTFWILREGKATVYNSMLEAKNNPKIEIDEREKIKETLNLLNLLYEIRDFYGLYKLVDNLINRTYFIETLLLIEGGKQSIANVYKFKQIVKEYEKSIGGTIEDFIDYLEDTMDKDESQGKIQSENSNVVKILTIHKSKGLQFPVVIIPEMSTGSRGNYPNILFHKEIGIGLKLDSGRALYDNIRKDLDKKDREERERILYVAMTRAERILILGCQGKNQGFKKLIKDLIDPNECRVISDINLELEGYEPVKLIKEELINNKEKTNIKIPLLYEIPEYNKRTMERYNISQYLRFIECNRGFYLDYYKQIAGKMEIAEDYEEKFALTALEKGNIIHKFCESYRLGTDDETLLKNICQAFGLDYNEKIKKELDPYVENYLKQYNEDYDKVYIEKEFYLKIGDNFITGIIDRINIKDNKAEIIDFKTNKMVNKHRLINQYTPQLQLYAYAVREILDIDIKRAGIHFLSTGEYVDIAIDEKELQNNLSNINRFIKFTLEHSHIQDYKKSANCSDYCKHKLICSLE